MSEAEIIDPDAPTKMIVARGMVWDKERRKPGDAITVPHKLTLWLRTRRKAGLTKAEAESYMAEVAEQRATPEDDAPDEGAGK